MVVPSVLWHRWLGDRKGIWPVKNWAVECWRGICRERGADLHMAQLMPLPLTVSCFSKSQIGFTFLVPAHPGSPGQRVVKRVCVCVWLAPLRVILFTIMLLSYWLKSVVHWYKAYWFHVSDDCNSTFLETVPFLEICISVFRYSSCV